LPNGGAPQWRKVRLRQYNDDDDADADAIGDVRILMMMEEN
jgi:hypothetical protein